jgi:hypothetical protein
MSTGGWLVLLAAVFSTILFVFGLFAGETAIVIPAAGTGSVSNSISYEKGPVFFLVVMAINALVSLVCWSLFIHWLKERQR